MRRRRRDVDVREGVDGFLTPYLLEPLPLEIEGKQCSEITGKMIYHHRIRHHIKFQPENGTSIKLASSPTSMAARLLKLHKRWYFSLVRARSVSRSTGPSQRSGKNGARGISIDWHNFEQTSKTNLVIFIVRLVSIKRLDWASAIFAAQLWYSYMETPSKRGMPKPAKQRAHSILPKHKYVLP